MPILRLRKHQANFSDEDILINQSDFPGLKLRDVVELRPPKGPTNPSSIQSNHDRILLQVRRWPEINQSYPNTVSIKDSVVNTHLKVYGDVVVNVVDKKEVLVDSIEICFSNAYLARSYMWGLRNHLNNRCVYQRQKLDYLHIRSQICEIWAQGNKVTSGYVDDDTKIVFRSASSLVYLFIQMSSEMWDYDINGDLYCEKAINGFLTDLFETWRQNDCSHDITIVLFSRTFYDAESLEEFPEEMRECLQVDYKGRFYEDCYRVAFQNDRFDLHDWNAKLTTLKSIFNQYQKEVINRHQEKYVTKIPRAYNSSASQGNFLEVLNMSLNVFEKHYFDRSFDRTGQLSVVVSPGVGVFEVDFEMTNLTKQRIIDNGIGSDLVCLGEQPLHTVPLLKFNSKSSQLDDNLATCDVYNMPHWINLSFYSSQNQVYYSNFVPRIKLPTLNSGNKLKSETSKSTLVGEQPSSRPRKDSSIMIQNEAPAATSNQQQQQQQPQQQQINSNQRRDRGLGNGVGPQMSSHHAPTVIPDLVDYDDYDAQVFKSNSSLVNYHCKQGTRGDRSILADMDPNVDYYLSDLDDDDQGEDGANNQGDDYDFLDRGHSHRANKGANIQRRSSDVKNYQEYSRNMKRQASENLPISSQARHHHHHHHQTSLNHHQGAQTTFTRMSLVDSYLTDLKIKPESADDLSVRGYNVQSSRLSRLAARPKALINPFDPSHMTIKLTPNRRRWTHVFPQGPTGTFIQQHHYQPMVSRSSCKPSALPYLADVSPMIPENAAVGAPPTAKRGFSSVSSASNHLTGPRQHPFPLSRNNANDNVSIARLSSAMDPAYHKSGTSSSSSKQALASGGLMPAPLTTSNNKSTLVSNDTIRFAWCASGEQEWTPAITTGVDWKSLTMPACLPLTTDFFPSKTSLQNDYVISEYNIDASFIHTRYTLIEVYRELVCQRLQKGFQIILLPGQQTTTTSGSSSPSNSSSTSAAAATTTTTTTTTTTSTTKQSTSQRSSALTSRHHHHHHHSHHHSHHGGRSSLTAVSKTATTKSSSLESSDVEHERTEYTMSIGRIFHKLALIGNTITVTHYRPRHPYPTIKIDYCYRFRAPFHETYGQSWVHFKSEKLEEYNWNYLDNYICARGESTFALRSSLKFWRFRILIMPSKLCLKKFPHSDQPATTSSSSSISNGSKETFAVTTNSNMASGNNAVTTTTTPTSNHEITRHDIYNQEYSDEERDALMESFVKLLEIINKTRRASACRASCSGHPSTSSSSTASSGRGGSSSSISSTATTVGCFMACCPAHQSKLASPSQLIVQIGTTAATTTKTTSSSCGDSQKGAGDTTTTKGDDKSESANQSDGQEGGGDELVRCGSELLLQFEAINMDIDSALRDARRAEWVHVQYHNFFDVYQAFELIIKWMVASGAGIAEMVQSWSRKVGNSSVHVVPIPWEPFAMPHSGKADPLRCPLVIQLHLNCLASSSSLDDNQVINLQERILRLFGFIRFHDLISTENIERQYIHLSGFAFVALPNLINDNNHDKQHQDRPKSLSNQNSATLQALESNPERGDQQRPILVTNTSKTKLVGPDQQGRGSSKSRDMPPTSTKAPVAPSLKLVHQETISSPHEEYITRHIGGARQNKTNRLRGENEQIEFIWSWNYMLTKRWRSPSTQDESYAVSLMQDFKDFCQNGGNRLVEFWDEIKTMV